MISLWQSALIAFIFLFALRVGAQSLEPISNAELTTQTSVNQSAEQTDGGDVWSAQQAYDRGKNNIASALYPEAEVALREALEYAPENTALRDDVERALYLELPISAVNQLVSEGQIQDAQSLLEKALMIVPPYPVYIARLEAIKRDLLAADLFNVTPNEPQPVVVDGAGVVDSIYQKMVEYRRLNGSYPVNRRDLDRLLPDGKPPLEHFRINYYRRTLGGGYSLEIQNKTNPEQTLRIDATGMME